MFLFLTMIMLLAAGSLSAADPLAAPYRRLTPVSYQQVKIDDAFWLKRLQVNEDVSIPANMDWCERTGRIDNFVKAAGLMSGGFEGLFFNDSDVYKVLEGASYALALHHDPELEKKVDEIIDKIAQAQKPDGYLNTYFTLAEPDNRWSNLRDKHELYCAGHLIEAAVAHYEATGKRTLLDVAIRFAGLIDSIYGPEKRHDIPGHEEIELALVKLYRTTGDERYLRLAQFFLDERGRHVYRVSYGQGIQDHLPIRMQHEIFGHAVRAMYLFSGVADVAAINGDAGFFEAMDAVWNDLSEHKLYITGGIGVSGHFEGFSGEYDLPNENAYAETCSSIALAFFNQRLALLHADGRYADLFEQVLYNGLLSGVSLDGDKFFYRNPLASRGPLTFEPSGGRGGDSTHHRQYWYDCACCPPNVIRFVEKIGECIYAYDADGLYINQYIGSRTEISLKGQNINLKMKSKFPWEGEVKIDVDPDSPCIFAVNLRLPSWCDRPKIRVNDKKVDYTIQNGYACLLRKWEEDDEIELELPMEIQRIEAHPLIKEDAGHVALKRGPIVYCLEAVDNSVSVRHIAAPPDTELLARYREDLLGGVTVIEGIGRIRTLSEWEGRLYRTRQKERAVCFTAVPYFAWDNREPDEMVVWLPESSALAPLLTIAGDSRMIASHFTPYDSLGALNDEIEPRSSSDNTVPRFSWWDHKGTHEWVQYDFRTPQPVSEVDVYWYDDRDRGRYRPPQSWRLLFKEGEKWKPVTGASDYSTTLNHYNRVTFDPIKTTALRIEAELQPDFTAGILEWRVF